MRSTYWLEGDPSRSGKPKYLEGDFSERKARLYACGYLRTLFAHPPDGATWEGVEAAEAFADGQFSNEARRTAAAKAYELAGRPWAGVKPDTPDWYRLKFERAVARILNEDAATVHWALSHADVPPGLPRQTPAEQVRIDVLLSFCVFGFPLRPVTVDPAWFTPVAVAPARQMYDSRDFSPMPILADALQDAGCEDAGVLVHGRRPGPHVRGCWVVDLVLGKS